MLGEKSIYYVLDLPESLDRACTSIVDCALPGFVDSKNEEKTERNAGYLVVSHSGGGMLRQGTRKGIRRENKDKYKPDINDHLKVIREKTKKQR